MPRMTSTATPTSPAPEKRSLNFVLICVFIDMLGIGVIIPVLPLMVGEFVEGRELQAYWYGVMATLFGIAQFLCLPALGAISDRVGRRPVLLLSMAGMGISFLVTGLAPNLALLFLGRVIGGMSSASMAVATAYASDVSTGETRAKSFGKVGAAFGLGFICGPMLGGVLGNIDLHLPFYVAAALCLANLVYGYFSVAESLPPSVRKPIDPHRLNPLAALPRLLRRPGLKGLIIVYALTTFAQVMLHLTWVLYTTFRFNWTPRDNGIALFCVGVASVVVQAGLLGVLIGRFGEVRVATTGLISGAVTFLLYGLATQGWMMYVLILCNVLAFAAGPALQGIISKATPSDEQGELMGSLHSLYSLAVVFVPALGTAILGQVSHLPAGDWRVGSTFYVSGALQTLSVLLAWREFKRLGREAGMQATTA
jgi:DHA1 family tetracycline resistance protein-like MFS transporter